MEHIGMIVRDENGTLVGYTASPVSKSAHRSWINRDDVYSSDEGRGVWGLTQSVIDRIFATYGREQERPAAHAAARPAQRWQDQPATTRQIEYLVALGVAVEPGMTKGRASELIDAAKGQDGIEYLGGQYAEGMQSIGEVY